MIDYVPNVPCGVESVGYNYQNLFLDPFLMYRVELKVLLLLLMAGSLPAFLMYRVELKGGIFQKDFSSTLCS